MTNGTRRLAAALAALFLAFAAHDGALAHDAHGLLHQAEPAAIAADAGETLTGTVHELIVDDATQLASQRYVELELDDGSLVPLRGDLAAQLTGGTRVRVSGRPFGAAVDVAAARRMQPAPAPLTKARAEIEGTFAVLHADDFANGRSAFVYEVHQASGRIARLHMGFLPRALTGGMHVQVVGQVEADESMTPERITIVAKPASLSAREGATLKAATANSVLVILANFNNTAAPAFTPTQMQQVMTSNADSVANYFREASYGQELMNVTVTPAWVTMSMPLPGSCADSVWQGIGSAANTAAAALGAAYNPSAYNFVVYVFPKVSSCGWVGLAYVGSPHLAWINGAGAVATQVITHEMGHNFGLLHAASLRCSGDSIGGSCTASEYGDPFDTMGNQRAMHYNAAQKADLAWIPDASVKTHTSGAVTYTLSPLEVAGGSTYAVRIPTASANRTYWLEFRQPIGFDAPLAAYPNNAVQIRVAAPFETLCSGCDSYSDNTELLDMTPGTSTFNDSALPVGQTFSDATYGVSVTVLSASASALTVQVATGAAFKIATPTTTTLSATPNPSLTGALVTISATVAGNAPTGSVSFTDNGAAIAGCSGVALAGSGNSRSASCSTNALTTGSHMLAAAYGGDAGNSASTGAPISEIVSAPVNGTNVALSSNGGTASASSTWGPSFPASTVIDNRRSGAGWGNYAGWADGTSGAFPDWVQINFNGQKAVDHVVVYSVQDNFLSPIEPTEAMTGTRFVLTSFDVQGWSGSAWVTLGSVTGNNRIKRIVTFAPYTTDRIRIVINATQDGVWSRLTEVEAWTSTTTVSNNYALASSGGTASASSTWGPSFPASTVIDNKRSGAGWGNYAGWADGTKGAFPDWLQINLSAQKSIDHVVVYSVQDNFLSPVEPTDTMTGTRFVAASFDVQGWNGSAWVTLASVTGNNLIKRTVWFPAYPTSQLRIVVNATQDGVWSRVTEVEAWGY